MTEDDSDGNGATDSEVDSATSDDNYDDDDGDDDDYGDGRR